MILGIFETRNFIFHAFGETKDKALDALRGAWSRHCLHTNADPGFLEEYKDDIQFLTAKLGMVFRDHDLFVA